MWPGYKARLMQQLLHVADKIGERLKGRTHTPCVCRCAHCSVPSQANLEQALHCVLSGIALQKCMHLTQPGGLYWSHICWCARFVDEQLSVAPLMRKTVSSRYHVLMCIHLMLLRTCHTAFTVFLFVNTSGVTHHITSCTDDNNCHLHHSPPLCL